MKKEIVKKRILTIVLLIFVFSQILLPFTVSAETKLDWPYPNRGKNEWRLSVTDIINSDLIMQVIGCTGVVNKISGAVLGLFQKASKEAAKVAKRKLRDAKRKALEEACEALKVSASTAVSGAPNISIYDPLLEKQCKTITVYDPAAEEAAEDKAKEEKANKTKDECINGIAIALAKNQLVSMTRSTMNWVSTGFAGDPMYIRNMGSYENSTRNRFLLEEIEFFQNPSWNKLYPYGRDYARSLVNSYLREKNFKLSLTESLSLRLSGGATIKQFSNDFSKGGWDGWLALTMEEKNNPIGYQMLTVDNLRENQEKEVERQKQEIITGQGLFDQKKCVEWKTWADETMGPEPLDETMGPPEPKLKDIPEEKRTAQNCSKWETITPGAVIKDKISTYINSPERQLELADTINKSLYVLFSVLIDKFRQGGLTSIGSGREMGSYPNSSGGWGSNKITDIYGNKIGLMSADRNNMGGVSGWSGPFNILRDLGNTYVQETTINRGKWDSNINKTNKQKPEEQRIEPKELRIGIGDINTYYEVDTDGNKKLFLNGYNSWKVGDRAFFNGNEWQNWRKAQNLPIEKRGVMQIQEDYIVAARELLSVLPGVMPVIGELDYCIPGPNPNWQIHSEKTNEAFNNYVSAMSIDHKQGNFWKLTRDFVFITRPEKTSMLYKNYRNIFNGTGELWNLVIKTSPWTEIEWGYNTRYDSDTKWPGNKGIQDANNWIDKTKQNIFNALESFIKKYSAQINELYGPKSPMQTQYLRKENTSELTLNSSYLAMASDGLRITKNILEHDTNIKEITEELKFNIITAQSNNAKLKTIRKAVNTIINAAQDRRDVNKEKILKDIMGRLGGKSGPPGSAPYIEALKIYENCLLNEEINYLMADDLLNLGDETTRCSDELDNDLDGYIDMNDADCNGSGNIDTGIIPPIIIYTQCSDGIDNDLDGLIDYEDPGCSSLKEIFGLPSYLEYNPNIDDESLDSVIIDFCTNGADNFSDCNTLNGFCITNGADNPPWCTVLNGVCINGASNPDLCDGQV